MSNENDPTWGHWCYEQEPTVLPVTTPRCPQCGALNVARAIPPAVSTEGAK